MESEKEDILFQYVIPRDIKKVSFISFSCIVGFSVVSSP